MLSSGVEDLANETSIWRSRGFQAYLGSTAFSGMALAMQQLLFSWILIGILELPADQVGLIQGLKKADIVSLHIPLNKFNHKFFNDRLLNLCNKFCNESKKLRIEIENLSKK